MFYVSVKIGEAMSQSEKPCKFQFLNTKKVYSLPCKVQCESGDSMTAASCGGVFDKRLI